MSASSFGMSRFSGFCSTVGASDNLELVVEGALPSLTLLSCESAVLSETDAAVCLRRGRGARVGKGGAEACGGGSATMGGVMGGGSIGSTIAVMSKGNTLILDTYDYSSPLV